MEESLTTFYQLRFSRGRGGTDMIEFPVFPRKFHQAFSSTIGRNLPRVSPQSNRTRKSKQAAICLVRKQYRPGIYPPYSFELLAISKWLRRRIRRKISHRLCFTTSFFLMYDIFVSGSPPSVVHPPLHYLALSVLPLPWPT